MYHCTSWYSSVPPCWYNIWNSQTRGKDYPKYKDLWFIFSRTVCMWFINHRSGSRPSGHTRRIWTLTSDDGGRWWRKIQRKLTLVMVNGTLGVVTCVQSVKTVRNFHLIREIENSWLRVVFFYWCVYNIMSGLSQCKHWNWFIMLKLSGCSYIIFIISLHTIDEC